MEIRAPGEGDARALVTLAALATGIGRAPGVMRAHLERGGLLVAEQQGEVVGLLAYRSDWFDCTFVSVVAVAEPARRRGVARALFEAVERLAPAPRLFSS